MRSIANFTATWLRRESGQDLAEYGLLLVLIAVVAAAAIALVGPAVSQLYVDVVTAWPS